MDSDADTDHDASHQNRDHRETGDLDFIAEPVGDSPSHAHHKVGSPVAS